VVYEVADCHRSTYASDSFKIGNPEEASWQTANATGALGYMDYGSVQKFAGAYQLQKRLDTL